MIANISQIRNLIESTTKADKKAGLRFAAYEFILHTQSLNAFDEGAPYRNWKEYNRNLGYKLSKKIPVSLIDSSLVANLIVYENDTHTMGLDPVAVSFGYIKSDYERCILEVTYR